MSTSIVEKFVGNLIEFKNDYWGRRPRVLTSCDPNYLINLLTLDDADTILANPGTRPPYVEVTHNGQAVREKVWTRSTACGFTTIPDSVNVDVLAAEFSKGSTLILNHLDNYHPTLKTVSDAFREVFKGTTKVVAFITPPQQQALGIHYDTFEGFIVQTHGTKTWNVYDQVHPLSTRKRGFRSGEVTADPVLEVTLRPGDCLYVPWGSPHYAQSQESISCHMTIMTVPLSWSGFLQKIFKSAIPREAFDDVPILQDNRIGSLHQGHEYLQALLTSVSSLDLWELVRETIAFQGTEQEPCAGFLQRDAKRFESVPNL